MRSKRIGIFGGTFDPPHLGHLLLAEEIREDFALDEVYFMPCNEPPHKDRPELTEAKHRFAMVVAATLHNSDFVASPVEVNRPGPSYSIDTVRELREDLGDETEIFFITGLDSFLEIETWKDHEDLLDACHAIVVSRPGHSLDEIDETLPDWITERVVDARPDEAGERRPIGHSLPSGEDPHADDAPTKPRIFLSDRLHIDISSTSIRTRIDEGRSIRYRVSSEVARYIEANGLYRHLAPAKEAAS